MEISLQTIPPPLPELEGAPAQEILLWAIRAFFPDVAVACSMQNCVVVDLAVRIEPRIEVFFLDTGFHFPETVETARQLRRRYRLNLVELRPEDDAAVYARDGYEACCAARKVAPMERYLEGKRAWVTGIRRAESPSRADAEAVEWDARRGLVKVNPIVAWTDEEVDRYVAERDLLTHPLLARGYGSVGCAPCTTPGEGRDGRWADTDKLECGLHTSEPHLDRPPERRRSPAWRVPVPLPAARPSGIPSPQLRAEGS